MVWLFSATLFVSAALLFWMQLMVGKLMLPLLGGSPAVWNTCLVFFQAMLLVAYGYAHLSTLRWNVRYQAIAHIGLLLMALPFLPIALAQGWAPPTAADPVLWLLALLTVSVGVPFFVVSTTAPLMQRWLAETDSPAGKDPYFLYAASNVGSLVGLVGYPLGLEPGLALSQQGWWWGVGYGALVVLVLGCAIGLWRSPKTVQLIAPGPFKAAAEFQEPAELEIERSPQDTAKPGLPLLSPATLRQQAQWVLLSFLPSSLLLGVTTYITTDLAAVPLLWAVPLMIYLLTFIGAFAQTALLPYGPLVTVLPLLLTPLCLLFLLQVVQPLVVLLPLHLLGLLVAAAVFHGALAQSRPAPAHLTLFYWWIAVGGLMGGVWNAIAAPLLFPTVLEYPLALLLGLWLLQGGDFQAAQWGKLRLRLTLPLGLGLLGGGLLVGMGGQWGGHSLAGLAGTIALVSVAGYAAGFGRWKLAVGLALVVLLNQFSIGAQAGVLASDRSFFGVYRVLQTTAHGGYHSLLHGTTLHGKQSLDPKRQNEPLTYFTRTGPMGQLFASVQQRSTALHSVGVLGLGVGTLAAYGQLGQTWTFYEIDPLAQRLATNPSYFRFLQDSPANVEIALGDGRLAIARAPDQSFDLLVMDAFSSDSIPIHLISQEAIRLYFAKLAPNGLLAINITNRFLDLNPVLGAIAQSLNLVSLTQSDLEVSDLERNQGKAPSRWVILARQGQDLGTLRDDSRWQAIAPTDAPVWTDDFSNILQALRHP